MTTTHTPGPWGHNDNGIILGNLDDFEGEAPTVAVVNGYDDDLNATEEAKANARLLVAAPDLLAALEQVMAWCASPADARTTSDIEDIVAAAIDQARGENAELAA